MIKDYFDAKANVDHEIQKLITLDVLLYERMRFIQKVLEGEWPKVNLKQIVDSALSDYERIERQTRPQ